MIFAVLGFSTNAVGYKLNTNAHLSLKRMTLVINNSFLHFPV